MSDLARRHGDVVAVTSAAGAATRTVVRAPLDAVLTAAVTPISYCTLAGKLHGLGGTDEQSRDLMLAAVDAGILISSLNAQMTETDPLGHLLDLLQASPSELAPSTMEVLDALEEVRSLMVDRERFAVGVDGAASRRALAGRMRGVSPGGRAPLAVDLRLDAAVTVPTTVLDEARAAADALVALTRDVGQKPTWAAYHSAFWERYRADTPRPAA